jgi:hypothetical protein
MSITDFKGIDLKIEEIYSDQVKGLAAITNVLKQSKDVMLTNIPPWLFGQIEKSLSQKKITLYTNHYEEVEKLTEKANYTSVEMKSIFNGQNVQRGNIFTKSSIFELEWEGSEILRISSFHFRPCINDFRKTYEDILIAEEVSSINYSTIFEPAEGIDYIKKVIHEAHKVRCMNIPLVIVEVVYPLIGEKDFQIICTDESSFIKDLDDASFIRITRSIFNFYSIYEGKKMGRGLILTDKEKVISIDFDANQIVSIRSTMWTKCSSLLLDNFKVAWIQAKKIKK